MLNYFVKGYNRTSEVSYPVYQAIDVLIFPVRDHFDQLSFLVFEQLEALLLKALKSEGASSELEFVRKRYEDNVNDLILELNIFKVGLSCLRNFCQIEIFNSFVRKKTSFVCLVFKIENK